MLHRLMVKFSLYSAPVRVEAKQANWVHGLFECVSLESSVEGGEK